jgi:tetratricopeptide (TPR) repeat protein
MKKHPAWLTYTRKGGAIYGLVILVALCTGAGIFAHDQEGMSGEVVASQAKAAWLEGSSNRALDILDQGILDFPQLSLLQKIRGDILTTIRRNQEALEAYEAVLQGKSESLGVRWAKWSVLTRLGEGDLAIEELRRIAKRESDNPLVHLRLAQELRKLDRLEESVESYRQAVQLAPEVLGWRLSFARALFDVLDYEGARKEVEGVLQNVPRGSPVETAARNLLKVVYGATKERGRRFQPIFSPEGTGADLKQWGLIRHKAWKLFTAGRYREAEPVLREVLTLRPSDQQATYELGSTLMELDRYEEAIDFLQKGIDLGASTEVYLDSVFRIGQCLVELERWSEALLHFELLQELASGQEASPPEASPEETQESTDDPPVIAGAKVLDKEKVAHWLAKVRQHLLITEKSTVDLSLVIPAPITSSPPLVQAEEEPARNLAGFEPVHSRTSLMGRDADFSWFRFLIPARMVMRDDLLMGSHEFIPIDPGDTFPMTQKNIYLVFALVTPSYDEIPLTAECFLETSKISSDQASLAQDRVVMTTNEQSGYFRFQILPEGWKPGLYRCGLFVGDEVSAYNQVDEVRFRIVPQD